MAIQVEEPYIVEPHPDGDWCIKRWGGRTIRRYASRDSAYSDAKDMAIRNGVPAAILFSSTGRVLDSWANDEYWDYKRWG